MVQERKDRESFCFLFCLRDWAEICIHKRIETFEHFVQILDSVTSEIRLPKPGWQVTGETEMAGTFSPVTTTFTCVPMTSKSKSHPTCLCRVQDLYTHFHTKHYLVGTQHVQNCPTMHLLTFLSHYNGTTIYPVTQAYKRWSYSAQMMSCLPLTYLSSVSCLAPLLLLPSSSI